MAKILIVDDDKNYRSAIGRMLRKMHHDVVEAENGRDAISSYKKSVIDIVITDILMPEKDGIELIMELKKEFRDVKIIAITGGIAKYNNSVNMLDQAKFLGACRVIEKPFENEELTAAVNEILEGN